MKPMRTFVISSLFAFLLSGCASLGGPLDVPPEFQQKIQLMVDDSYQMYQAPRSGYDVGDLQNFHSQHTLPILVEESFKEMFSQVEMIKGEAGIEAGAPDVPAIFEVRLADLANDIYNEADSYRAQATLAVAMKSPGGKVFWQEAFRGEGYVNVDPQFSNQMGPQDAVVAAVNDAIGQMQDAIIHSPAVRAQMKYYKASDEARREKEVTI